MLAPALKAARGVPPAMCLTLLCLLFMLVLLLSEGWYGGILSVPPVGQAGGDGLRTQPGSPREADQAGYRQRTLYEHSHARIK